MSQRRNLSESLRQWLTGELDEWQRAALISPEQAARILDYYESPQHARERRQGWLLSSLVGLAMVLFAAAVLLLVSFNWQAIPAAGKLTLIFGGIGATYALAFYLRYFRRARLTSDAVFLLGSLLYGAGIWLVAQVFHMSAHYPDGAFWWAIGVLPLAFLLDSLALHALLVSLVALWCGLEMFNFPHLGALVFGWRWRLVPNSCYLALAITVAGLALAYHRNSAWRVALYAALLTWWTVLQPLAWHRGENAVFFIGAVGALLLVAAESHARGSQLAIPYRLFGALLFGGTLYLLSFAEFYHWVLYVESATAVFVTSGAILGAAALAFGIGEWLRYHYLEQGQATLAKRLDDLRQRQWLPLAMVVLMVALSLLQVIHLGDRPDSGWETIVPLLATNGAMIALAIWLMWTGLREDRGLPFAGGILYFLLWIVSRYFDLFGQFGGMLGAALMFFVCGLAVLAVVWFWRNRKQVSHV